jgi:hypothetical protein
MVRIYVVLMQERSIIRRLILGHDIDPVTISPEPVKPRLDGETFDRLIEKWVSDCNRHHKCVFWARGKEWHPKRLIHVGAEGDPLQVPRLCESESITPNSRYVTLSHCWGKTPIFRLLKSNLTSLTTALPLDKLPRVFCDAIGITQRLAKIDYIWIDSLCIIQDSDEDWEEQAAVMGEVYQNAFLNIGATGFSNGQPGLYSRKPSPPLDVQKIVIGETLYGESVYPCTWYCCEPFVDLQLNKAPLVQRAWVFQERVLAPRMLHFGSRQIFWECGKLEASESFPNGVPDLLKIYFKTSPDRSSIRLLDPVTFNHEGIAISGLLHRPWQRLVSEYNSRDLTRYTDKLVAISGIARLFKHHLKEKYVAGLWDSPDLITQLTWYIALTERMQSSIKSHIYQAPSWSWAAVNATVTFVDLGLAKLATVEEVHVETVNGKEFGPVISGYIRIRCRPFRATFSDDDETLQKRQTKAETNVAIRTIPQGTETVTSITAIPDNWQATTASHAQRLRLAVGGRDFYLMPTCLRTAWFGIVLVRTEMKAQYRRVGYFDATNGAEKVFASHAPYLDPKDYEKSHGDDQYTICII